MKALSEAFSRREMSKSMSPKSRHPATIHDVAKRARVSISTVSRVLNQTVPVSEEVRQRVEKAMSQLKFVPRMAARNLALRATNALVLLSTDSDGDFFAPLLNSIDTVASDSGYNLLIST